MSAKIVGYFGYWLLPTRD